MMPGHARILTCLLMMLCLHALQTHIYNKLFIIISIHVTPHLLFALLTTSRLDTSLYCLLPMLVFVVLLTTWAQY